MSSPGRAALYTDDRYHIELYPLCNSTQKARFAPNSLAFLGGHTALLIANLNVISSEDWYSGKGFLLVLFSSSSCCHIVCMLD